MKLEIIIRNEKPRRYVYFKINSVEEDDPRRKSDSFY